MAKEVQYGMQEVIGIELFLNTLPMEKKLWVMEKKPGTCIKAGELADEYEQARQQEIQPGVASEKRTRSQPTQRKQTGEQKNFEFVEEWDTWNTSAG